MNVHSTYLSLYNKLSSSSYFFILYLCTLFFSLFFLLDICYYLYEYTGNYRDDSHGECSVPMYHRFHTPLNGHGLYWYSFDFGNTHVIQMSSEHEYSPGSEQYLWMEGDLKRIDRKMTPFVVREENKYECFFISYVISNLICDKQSDM